MFVLGLLILAAVVVGAVELVLANRTGIDFKMWNQTWHVDAFWLAAMGAAGLLGVVVAVWFMRVSMARTLRLRAERRELAAENERLAKRAAQPRAAQAPGKAYPAAPAYAAPATAPPAPPTPGAPAAQAPAAEPAVADRPVAYAGRGAHSATGDGTTKHHRFFSRNSDH